MHKTDQRWIWVSLGITSILLRIICPTSWIEYGYSRGFFIGIRYLFDYTLGLLPVPMLYVFVLVLIVWLGSRFYRRRQDQRTIINRVLNFLFSLLAFLSGVVFFFLLLWGFNYGRLPIENHLNILPQPLEEVSLLEEFQTATDQLTSAYTKVAHLDSSSYTEYVFNRDLEAQIRKEVSATLQRHGYPSPGRVRARMLYPKGILLRISTAGFYMPLVAECNVDAGLHPLQIPYVMAHEFAHGYGFGNEGTCNFLAYLTCTSSADPVMNYTGLLSYWRSVAAQYRRVNKEHYQSIRDNLPTGILLHMKQINDQMDLYPDIFPAVRDATYNAYLKSQGVEEGLKSYSRVVLLVQAYRKKKLAE